MIYSRKHYLTICVNDKQKLQKFEWAIEMTITFYDLSGLEGRRFSPFGWRVRMALAHKGLEGTAKVEHISFSDKHKLNFSGQSLVPVIVDGKKIVSDSWDIAVYLDSKYPESPSLFGNQTEESIARFVAAWVDSQIHPLVGRCVVADIMNVIEPKDQPYFKKSREKRFGMRLEEIVSKRQEAKDQLKLVLYPARKTLENCDFLAGTAPKFVDYALFGAFMWARITSPFQLLEETDPLNKWLENMLNLYDGMPRTETSLAD